MKKEKDKITKNFEKFKKIIKEINENKFLDLFDLKGVKKEIRQLNKTHSKLPNYVDTLLEYSKYCVFKKEDGEYFIPYSIETSEFSYESHHYSSKFTNLGFEIIIHDEVGRESVILDQIEEIKEISELNEKEFIKLYNKYKSEYPNYSQIYNVDKYKYIIQSDKYNL